MRIIFNLGMVLYWLAKQYICLIILIMLTLQNCQKMNPSLKTSTSAVIGYGGLQEDMLAFKIPFL
jgi:hypothetical protein